MDPQETETAVGKNFNPDSPYAANSIYFPGHDTPIAGCPAPRKIIADTGAAVDLIGARDLHNKDKQKKTSEPIHFCTANGTTKADTIVQYFSSALGENVTPHVLTDSVSALSIGKRIANGCEFHWTPKNNNDPGSCVLIKPDGKRIEFEVDEHDVPYLLENRATAVPAQIPTNKENVQPTATQIAESRAQSDQRLRSILRETGPVPAPIGRTDSPPEPIEYDYSEVDEENDRDLRRRGDKEFLIEDAKSLTHLCTHLPKNPYCTSCMRSKINQKQKRRRRGKKHTVEATKFGDSVTGDHLISNGVLSNGIDSETVGFLLRDHATKFKQLYPAATKSAKECEIALKRFQGPMHSNRILHLYTDGAPEIIKAGKNLRHAMILAHRTGLLLMVSLSGRLEMFWRVPGRCLSTPGCQIPTGLMPAVAFATMRIYAWWRVTVLGINVTNRDISKVRLYHLGH